MRQLWVYFRVHPWQRRVLTSLAALVFGGGAAMILYPRYVDHCLMRDLKSEDAGVREAAVADSARRARKSQRFFRRLESTLDTGSDREFRSVAAVLRRLERMDLIKRTPRRYDHWLAIGIESTRTPRDPQGAADARAAMLTEMILSGRGNEYVVRALRSAAGDRAQLVRELAALLAARLRDDDVLRKLLRDDNPTVAAAAAIDAGLGGRKALVGPIRKLLAGSDVRVVSSAAYALARLEPDRSAREIAEILAGTKSDDLRDRLLHVMTLLDNDVARDAVLKAIRDAREAKKHPSAAALIAAGRLKIAESAPAVRAILASVGGAEDSGLFQPQLMSALQAADRLGLAVRAEVYAICKRRWGRDLQPAMVLAARLLGKQAVAPQPAGTDAPTRDECITLLRAAATYVGREEQTNGAGPATGTPLASAAAAVALWLIEPDDNDSEIVPSDDDPRMMVLKFDRNSSAFFVRRAAGAGTTLPGDYVAWHLGRSGNPKAFDLGGNMLPASGGPVYFRVYNANERSAGAMLMALSASSGEQRKSAVKRIASRLEGDQDWLERGACKCALVILGEQKYVADIHVLLEMTQFPQRRVLTAMCIAGERRGLEWLLWNSGFQPGYLLRAGMRNRGLAEVISAVLPALPRVDVAAEEDLGLWQLRILRDAWVLADDGAGGGASQ